MINCIDIIIIFYHVGSEVFGQYRKRVEIHFRIYFNKARNLRLFLWSNIDADELPNYVPSYYMNAIKNWSRLSEPPKEIMAKSSLQPL